MKGREGEMIRVSETAAFALALGLLAACATPFTSATTPHSADACGAQAHKAFVGKLRSEIPPAPADANWRIACTTCAVTMDYRPDRLNIFFDEKTDVIEEVKCG